MGRFYRYNDDKQWILGKTYQIEIVKERDHSYLRNTFSKALGRGGAIWQDTYNWYYAIYVLPIAICVNRL